MSVVRTAQANFAGFLLGFSRAEPEEMLHAAKVALWVRWFALAFCLGEVNYRVDYGALSHILNNFYVLWWAVANGYVYYLVRRSQTAKPAWLFGLSVMDLVGISFSTSLSGGFHSPLLSFLLLCGGHFRLGVCLPAPRPAVDDSGGGGLHRAERYD